MRHRARVGRLTLARLADHSVPDRPTLPCARISARTGGVPERRHRFDQCLEPARRRLPFSRRRSASLWSGAPQPGPLSPLVIAGLAELRPCCRHVDCPCLRRGRRHSSVAGGAGVPRPIRFCGFMASPWRYGLAAADAPSRAPAGAGRPVLPGAAWSPRYGRRPCWRRPSTSPGFLGFFALYGNPAGALRSIAIADIAAVPPLAFAAWTTFVRG